ncbi:KGGVGR-motif variant AAA ATPase [Hyphomicrobiales bacterium]|uniref:tyrosine-protein kinase family protein n=1 Tax=Agrobacterium radiobacter TaxID=362 RepID=UPI000DDBC6EF
MTTFDLSLPIIVDLVSEVWGSAAVERNLFLRDALGRLTVIVLEVDRTSMDREKLSEKITARLGSYADPSGISVATPDELFDDSLRDPEIGIAFPVAGANFQGEVRVVDRRVVGADWLRRPDAKHSTIPRLFFVSLKGGVGRSTALCVLAAHFAASGRRVLAIDMDLEAPGLGTMLLDGANLPRFGLLDYLVETNLGEVDDGFLNDMLGFSELSGGRGSITVVPALGKLANDSPLNVLGKLARAYLPSENDPSLNSFTAKIEKLIERLTAAGAYDIVLVDARAGLHESTAAAAVALQGDTLVFGMDQPQTYAGYRALLAQQALTLGSGWTTRIHLVEAKASANGPSDEFISNMIDILPGLQGSELVPRISMNDLRSTFNVEWDDSAPAELIIDPEINHTHIYESDSFARFDPLKHPDRLSRGMYAAVYGHFLETCDDIIQSAELIKGRL